MELLRQNPCPLNGRQAAPEETPAGAWKHLEQQHLCDTRTSDAAGKAPSRRNAHEAALQEPERLHTRLSCKNDSFGNHMVIDVINMSTFTHLHC